MVTKNRAKWTMLWTYLITFVLVLALAGNASAAARTWDGGGGAGNRLWSTPANWSADTVPTSADTAQLNIADANCLIDSSVTDARCKILDVSYDTGVCYLKVTGGLLTTGPSYDATLSVGTWKDGNGVFTMTGGDVNTGTGRLWIGWAGTGTFTITDGNLYVTGDKIEIGKAGPTGPPEAPADSHAVGVLNVYGGYVHATVNTSADLEIGKYGTGTLNMTGGDVNIADAIKLSEIDGTSTVDISGGYIHCSDFRMPAGTPTLYLRDGDINCSDEFSMASDKAKMDVYEGTLIVQNEDYLDDLYDYVRAGKIIGYGGEGSPVITPSGGGIGYSTVTARPKDANLASGAKPSDYAIVDWTPAGPNTLISWKPGQYAAKHDVYFGTNRNDVNDANRADPELLYLKRDTNSFSFPVALCPPVLGRTYYWRIDEVNDVCDPCNWKGLVWQFKMADYEEVESFNSYTSSAALQAVWSLTGSAITRETAAAKVHGIGGYSMKYAYTKDSATEAYASTTDVNKLPVDINNWKTADIKALTLYFRGAADNNAEKMYVALESKDGKSKDVYYDGDANDLKVTNWHEWNIKLSDFNDGGVNLSDVNKVYIGFDTPTKDGAVWFDDIRLYPRRCVASRLPAGFGDIGGISGVGEKDCHVNFIDVNMMKTEWLKADYNGVGRNGVLKGGASWVDDTTGDSPRGRCIQVDGNDGWVDLDDDDFGNFRNKTIAFWVKIREYPTVNRYMFYFNDTKEDAPTNPNPYRIYFMTFTPANYYVRARFMANYSANCTAGLDAWTHLAFVLEDTPDGQCQGTFYGDGIPIGTPLAGPRHSGIATGVNLGSENDGRANNVNAIFDDFRVYDYNLTGGEVATLAGGGEPGGNMLLHYDFNEVDPNTVAHNLSNYVYYHPLLSDAELYKGEDPGDRAVDFRDFALVADSWLKEQLWP
jgi:hypothetical protein